MVLTTHRCGGRRRRGVWYHGVCSKVEHASITRSLFAFPNLPHCVSWPGWMASTPVPALRLHYTQGKPKSGSSRWCSEAGALPNAGHSAQGRSPGWSPWKGRALWGDVTGVHTRESRTFCFLVFRQWKATHSTYALPTSSSILMLLGSFLSLLELQLNQSAFPNQLSCLQQWEFLFVSNVTLYLWYKLLQALCCANTGI